MPPKPKTDFNRRRAIQPRVPKPCPLCYRPMLLINERLKRYSCPTHGEPR